MPLDPSIYSQVGAGPAATQPLNPLAMMQQSAQTANALIGAKRAGLELNAQQAIGQNVQQATDPTTGLIDVPTLQRLNAANSDAAFGAQAASSQSQDLKNAQLVQQQRQLENTQAQYNQTIQQLSAGASGMAAILASNNGLLPYSEAKSFNDDMVKQGYLSADKEPAVMAGFGPDPFKNAEVARGRLAANLNAQSAAAAGLKNIGISHQAYGDVPYSQNPALAGPSAGTVDQMPGGVGAGLSPSDLASQKSIVDSRQLLPNGQPNPNYGQTVPVSMQQVLNTEGISTAPNSPTFGTGRGSIPPALLNPNSQQSPSGTAAPAATAPAASTSAPAIPAPSPTSPAQGAAMPMVSSLAPDADVEMKGSADHAVAARQLAQGYQQRIQPMELALNSLSGADTGKGSETLNSLRANIQDLTPSFIQKFLPASLTDPDKRIAFEEVNKALTQMQLAAPGGTQSKEGLAAAGAATPSVHIGNQTATLITQALLAQQRLQQAGTLAFNKTNLPGSAYDKYMDHWNTGADPRAFIADKMSGPEREAYVKSLGGSNSAAYLKYKHSYLEGVQNDVIPSNAGQQ